MRVIHCEQCGTPLPWTAQFCATCGAAVSLHPLISDYPDTSSHYTKRQHTGSLKTIAFYKMGQSDPDETQRINHTLVRANSTPLPALPAFEDAAASRAFVEDWSEDEEIDSETSRLDTWQKFVTRKTPAIPAGTPPYRVPADAQPLAPALENAAPLRERIVPSLGNGATLRITCRACNPAI